jgi:hypothetical protein
VYVFAHIPRNHLKILLEEKILGYEELEVTGGWRKSHNEVLHNFSTHHYMLLG